LHAGLSDRLSDLQVNGTMEHWLPHNLNIGFHGVEGETLLLGLDNVAVSSGAACTSVSPEPSHVLIAMGLSNELARASLRLGLGRWNTPSEVDVVVEKVSSLVTRLREMSPGRH
jgi:cysteine desulfurase